MQAEKRIDAACKFFFREFLRRAIFDPPADSDAHAFVF